MKAPIILLLCLLYFCACQKEEEPYIPENEIYFPSVNSDVWEIISPDSLNWDTTQLNDLYEFLEAEKTRAFIILKNGKIVVEKYWGNNILETAAFGKDSKWYWASAGKTLMSLAIGVAHEQNILNIKDSSSDYLGNGWTSMPLEQERMISVENHLMMSTGLDFTQSNLDCTDPECLTYLNDPGEKWFYHNAPYSLLASVISSASGQDFENYINSQITEKIGFTGLWNSNGFNHVFYSTPREAARFGLLLLNKGTWDKQEILSDKSYYDDMINTSQSLNLSYGYLTWLNGKSNIIYPGLENVFNTSLSPNAPNDMFAAIGKNGQIINIVPSENLVIVRMGESADDSLIPASLQNDLWEKLSLLLNL